MGVEGGGNTHESGRNIGLREYSHEAGNYDGGEIDLRIECVNRDNEMNRMADYEGEERYNEERGRLVSEVSFYQKKYPLGKMRWYSFLNDHTENTSGRTYDPHKYSLGVLREFFKDFGRNKVEIRSEIISKLGAGYSEE